MAYVIHPNSISLPIATTPNRLFNHLIQHLGCKHDKALAAILGIEPSTIYNKRNTAKPEVAYHRNLTANHLIRMHDVTGISIDRLRDLAGIQYHKTHSTTT
jgi:hypothetical protein